MNTPTTKPNLLPPGIHGGFAKLKSQPSVFRCKLRPVTSKRKATDCDYGGLLQLDGGTKASVMLWER